MDFTDKMSLMALVVGFAAVLGLIGYAIYYKVEDNNYQDKVVAQCKELGGLAVKVVDQYGKYRESAFICLSGVTQIDIPRD